MDDEIRQFVLDRDDERCQSCGSGDELHVHHIKPQDEGGIDHPHNLVTLCSSCHKHLESFGERVQRKSLRQRGLVDGLLKGTISQENKAEYSDTDPQGLLTDSEKALIKSGLVSPHAEMDIHRSLEMRVQKIQSDMLFLRKNGQEKLFREFLRRLDAEEILEERVRELQEQIGSIVETEDSISDADVETPFRNRALLTKGDREALASDGDVSETLENTRYNVSKRTERMKEDVELLKEAGEDGLVQKFDEVTSSQSRLKHQVKQLEKQMQQVKEQVENDG